MWIPTAYRINEIPVVHHFINRYNFATLVSSEGTLLHSTPLPFLLKPNEGAYGTLIAHLAKANPQSKTLASGREAMVIFQGPHAYISPNWYLNQQTAVPTWNHTTVCAYGIPNILTGDEVLQALRALVLQHESKFMQPWTLETAPAYVSKLLSFIVAFELPITRLEGQFKLSQDRPADLPGVIQALDSRADSSEKELAQMMKARFRDDKQIAANA